MLGPESTWPCRSQTRGYDLTKQRGKTQTTTTSYLHRLNWLIRHIERDRERERQRQRDKERDGETETDRHRETKRQTQRDTETERQVGLPI